MVLSEGINLAGWGWPSFLHQRAGAGRSTLQGGRRSPVGNLGLTRSAQAVTARGEKNGTQADNDCKRGNAKHGTDLTSSSAQDAGKPLWGAVMSDTWPYCGPEPNSEDEWPLFLLSHRIRADSGLSGLLREMRC